MQRIGVDGAINECQQTVWTVDLSIITTVMEIPFTVGLSPENQSSLQRSGSAEITVTAGEPSTSSSLALTAANYESISTNLSMLAGGPKSNTESPADDSSPQVSGHWSQGMDNSQQAILSEEALLQHTRDLFSLSPSFFSRNDSFFTSTDNLSPENIKSNPDVISTPLQHSDIVPLESTSDPIMSHSVLSPANYMNVYGDHFMESSQLQSDNTSSEVRNSLVQEYNHDLNDLDDREIKRPRSPTILEAAAMAADILEAENNPNNTNTIKKQRPCDSCRRRKARCIMLPSDTGRCLHCEVKKQPCTFLEAPVRRNRPKKNSVSTTSLTKAETPENTADTESSLIEAEGGPGGQRSAPSTEPNIAPQRLKYEDYASLGGHALLKKALSLQYPRSSYFIGPTSVFDTRLLEATPLDSQGRALLAGDIELRKVSNDVMFSLKNDYSEALYERSIQNVDAVEHLVAPHGQTLIDLYFRTIHPCFPILHKKVFLEKYKRTHREFMAPLLAAVYILALNWWNYDPALSALPKPDVDALFTLGIHTFSDALDRPKLSSVQAGLLLLQCQPNHNRSWMLCSQVVAVTEELGIGLDSGKWRLPQWERGLRRRLAWAVWLQDKWLSLSEARPSHIDRLRTWHIKHVKADDFPERHESDQEGSAEVESGRLLFMEFIKLTEIIEDMTDNLFTVRSVRLLVQTEKILEEIKPLQIRLRTWYHNLPPQLSMSVSRPRKLSSNGYLHLAYFATEITLHRRIIRSLNSKSPPMLLKICREAARQRLIAAMDFVRNLRPEHLQAFWYSSSASNFALIGSFAALLHVTAEASEEADFYKSKIRDYRWVLRVSASGFEPMAGAMRLLDIALCRVPQLLDDLPYSNNTEGDGGSNSNQGAAAAVTQHIKPAKAPVIDHDEEGDGQEDFSNETPRYAYVRDDARIKQDLLSASERLVAKQMSHTIGPRVVPETGGVKRESESPGRSPTKKQKIDGDAAT